MSILAQCSPRNRNKAANYAERGIIVCEEWRESFDRFLSDMGRIPHPEWGIMRLDTMKSYNRDNCRWADPVTKEKNWHPHRKTGRIAA